MIEVTLKFDSMAAAAAFFNAPTIENTTTQCAESNANWDVTRAPTAQQIADTVDAAATPAKEKKTRTKKETAPSADAAKPVDPQPEKESGDDQPKYSLNDVRTALADYVGRHDFTKGTALVHSFLKEDGTEASRLTEIQDCDYAKFIEAAKA
jgi:tRNA U38,U39,U40 pseudouridine synthase TruA